eukprot:TRINITY_DN28013_c0_g1_i1.p1 TRINITY_DN28013_c0_g1~~TRINITY_DN28013_c0_g1_i1.p1  ORF type:complete len:795 (-),score=115.48 TRINITY_DN28013_c0_g1_i1:250-2634(-)
MLRTCHRSIHFCSRSSQRPAVVRALPWKSVRWTAALSGNDDFSFRSTVSLGQVLGAIGLAASGGAGSYYCYLHANRESSEIDLQGARVSPDLGKVAFEEPTPFEKLHFLVDDYLNTSGHPRVAILSGTTGLLLTLGAVTFYHGSGVKLSAREALWIAWTTLVDPGTHTVIPSSQWRMRLISIIFTLGGLMFFALLIGLMTDGVSAYMDELAGGDSRLLVSDHILLLGWSAKVPSMLTQIGKDFDASTSSTCVALTETPIEEEVVLENQARVFYRRGDPARVDDLVKVCPNSARSIIIFSPPCDDDAEADALVMARTMALLSLDVTVPIVLEIRDKDNLAVVRKMLKKQEERLRYKHHVLPLAGGDIVGNMMVQGALQPGLAKVVHHLLDYKYGQANEVHMQSVAALPELKGKTFGEAVFMLDGAVALGVHHERYKGRSRCAPHCGLLLNPPDHLVLQEGDTICAIARSKDQFSPRKSPGKHVDGRDFFKAHSGHRKPRQLLICNWRDDMEDIFKEIDKRTARGTVVTVLSHFTKQERLELIEQGGGMCTLRNIRIKHVKGQAFKQSILSQVMSKTHFDGVMVFSNDISKDANTADARAAVCSLLVHSLLESSKASRLEARRRQLEDFENMPEWRKKLVRICGKTPRAEPDASGQVEDEDLGLITEIKKRCSLQVLRVAGVSNFVIANELSAMMMVHLAHAPELRHFWIDNVFNNQGQSFRIGAVSSYVDCTRVDDLASLSFWDLLAICRAAGVTPIAIKKAGHDTSFIFNPPDKAAPLKLRANDQVVVLEQRQD